MGFWRGVFALAALFNLAAGGAMLVDPDHVFALMGMPRPIVDLLPVAVTGWLIACFGFAYPLVALRPERNTDIVRFATATDASSTFRRSSSKTREQQPRSSPR